jgi:hypothetical protein
MSSYDFVPVFLFLQNYLRNGRKLESRKYTACRVKNYMTALCFYDYLKDKLGNPRTLTGAIGLTAVASNPVQALMSQG